MISEQIEGPDASEVEYWGAVLQRVKLAKKRAIVEETHKELKVKFEREEIEDGGRARSLVTAAPAEEDDDGDDLLGDDFGKHTADDDARDGGEWDDTGDEPERTALAEFDPSLSPMRLQEVEDGIEIIDIDQEEANLTRFREEERIKSMSRFMQRPDVMVYLDVSPEESLRRIRSRQRDCESGMTLDYLVKLHAAYEAFISDISKSMQCVHGTRAPYLSPPASLALPLHAT